MSQQKKTSAIYKRLLAYILPFKHVLVLGIIANVIYSGVDAGFTYMIKPAMDKGFSGQHIEFVKFIPWFILLGITFRGLISGVAGYCMTWVSRQVIMVLRQKVFTHILHLPVKHYDQCASGQLLSKLLYDVEQVAQVSSDALTTFVQSSCLIVGLLGVMFVINWQLSLLFLLTTPLIGLIVNYTNKKTRKVSHDVQRSMGNVTEIASEAIDGYQVVRVFGGQKLEQDKFDGATEYARQRDMKVAKIKLINVAGVQFVIAIGVAAIVGMAIYLSESTDIGAGGFVSILAAVLQLIKPMKDLSTVNSTIQRGLAGAESIFELFDSELEPTNGLEILKNVKGELTFKNVIFKYNAKKPVFNALNLTLPAGKTVALVGRSGSGKSTLAHLIPRFYELSGGMILLDGENIQNYSLLALRSSMSLVSQQVMLFNDTIAANIAYGQQGVNIQQIKQAAKRSYAFDFIEALPNGFDTLVGENGSLLSGGQRQRIAIARALLKNAPLLILDEATSALDNESERYIQKALETAKQGRTTLVIAHRLSTIESADLIVVLDEGCIVEQGTHSELLANQSYYAALYHSQFDEGALL